MELSHIVNTPARPVPTQAVLPFGEESFAATRYGLLTKGDAEDFIVVTKPAILDLFSVSSSNEGSPRLSIQRRLPNGTFQGISFTNASGTAGTSLNIKELVENGVEIFDVRIYDKVAGKIKIALNRPLVFPNGFKIVLDNPFGATSPTVGATLYGRSF